jgi:hypothetical protein
MGLFVFDEEPEEGTWSETFCGMFGTPSPKLQIKRMKNILHRRILVLEVEIQRYEHYRKTKEKELDRLLRRSNCTNTSQNILGEQIANYAELQIRCGMSIVRYQKGLQTVTQLEQMRDTTMDFAMITKELSRMNRTLNLRNIVFMTRSYDRHMDIMEDKDTFVKEALLDRNDMDEDTQKQGKMYVDKARTRAGLATETQLSNAERRTPQSGNAIIHSDSSSNPNMNAGNLSPEDEDLIRQVNNL